MGPLSSTDRPGLVAVDKYLLPNEVQVATVRRHPAVLIGPSAVALIGLLVAGVLSATVASSSHPALLVIWGIEVILVLRLLWKAWNWAVDYFVVTSARLLLTSGVFTRKVAMMPLTKVTDLSFQRSFAGRMLGYGEFIVESAGQNQALTNVDHIPYPEHLYLLVCGMIFPESVEPAEEDPDVDNYGEDPQELPPDDGPAEPGDEYDEYEYDLADPDYDGEARTTRVQPVVVDDDPGGRWMRRRPRRGFRVIRRGRRDPNDEL